MFELVVVVRLYVSLSENVLARSSQEQLKQEIGAGRVVKL